MRIKQVKLAQGLPGSASNIIDDKSYDMVFDKGILTVKHKTNKKYGGFMIFPANIAHIELHHEEVTEAPSQGAGEELPTAKGKKTVKA